MLLLYEIVSNTATMTEAIIYVYHVHVVTRFVSLFVCYELFVVYIIGVLRGGGQGGLGPPPLKLVKV